MATIATLTPHQFVHKWRQTDFKERSASQEHFIDICHLIGHPTPVESDPSGESFTFEAGASKVTGGKQTLHTTDRHHVGRSSPARDPQPFRLVMCLM